MTILEPFKHSLTSTMDKEKYKKDVRQAVELLIMLGVLDDNQSDDLNAAVESVIQKMRRDEVTLYGKELTKENILQELGQVNSELERLKQEQLEVNKQIALEELKLKAKDIDFNG
jgi:hypothetical protein